MEAGRDVPPPGSILNANISGFWLTMDLLDVDNQTPSGKILPVLLQVRPNPEIRNPNPGTQNPICLEMISCHPIWEPM